MGHWLHHLPNGRGAATVSREVRVCNLSENSEARVQISTGISGCRHRPDFQTAGESRCCISMVATNRNLFLLRQVIDSKQRLGAQDIGGYASIKEHEFFKSIDFESLHLKTPPRPSGYTDSDDELAPTSHSPEFQGVEPGLGGQQLSRLLGFQLNDDSILVNSTSETKPPETKLSETAVKSPLPTAATVSTAITTTLPAKVVQSKRTLLNIPATEEQLDLRLKHQQENLSQWHHIVEKKLILKQGLIDKRKASRLANFHLTN